MNQLSKTRRAWDEDDLRLYDLHVHTYLSEDSNADPKLIVKASVKKGLSGIAITDHNRIIGAYEAMRYAPEDFEVIVGEEVKTKQGDLIGLNISERIKPNLDAEETIDRIKEQGGTVVLPHPFRAFRGRVKGELLSAFDRIDLIEVINGRSFFFDNFLSRKLAEICNKPGIGGSDAHFYFELGRVSVDLSHGLLKPGKIFIRPFRPKIYPIFLSWFIKLSRRKFLSRDFEQQTGCETTLIDASRSAYELFKGSSNIEFRNEEIFETICFLLKFRLCSYDSFIRLFKKLSGDLK